MPIAHAASRVRLLGTTEYLYCQAWMPAPMIRLRIGVDKSVVPWKAPNQRSYSA